MQYSSIHSYSLRIAGTLLATLAFGACTEAQTTAPTQATSSAISAPAAASHATPTASLATKLPDFAAIKDVKAKKQAFFDFMRPIVHAENAKIAIARDRLIQLKTAFESTGSLSTSDQTWLNNLAEQYRVEFKDGAQAQAWATLLRRVDIVPFRLALSQSANESSWGTSRFAKQGLNFFGQWCFSKGCGIVPSQRSAGMSHEVAKFSSVNASVASYIQNLNRGDMYQPLRLIREKMRHNGEQPTAHALAAGLLGYSERGQDYVDEIRTMIRINTKLMGEDPAL